ncbi:hypothetical protein KSP40_PGU010850 [Platanthera guangdongensis]|uniref:Uncharacterized protein n=1 Tax=Platanthera guangdongensis TaxID=2320717 RepID=A0ABR2MTG5_9ASPA
MKNSETAIPSSSSSSSSNNFFHLLVVYLVISPPITLCLSAQRDNCVGREGSREDDDRHAPHAAERGIGITGHFNSHLEVIWAWAKLDWMNINFGLPDSAGKGHSMKEASKRSYEVSKETVEQTAAAAGKAALRMVRGRSPVSNSDEELEAEL